MKFLEEIKAIWHFSYFHKGKIRFIPLKYTDKVILENHTGLEFLKSTPEFQDRYSETVIFRIFYCLDKNNTGYITWREFKQSKFLEALIQLEEESDINKIRDFFSYEHFYVIYIKFWELDTDHDFFISKEEFSKYSGHALSTKIVDRIFDCVPVRLKSTKANFMSYEDFAYFLLCEENKTSFKSIDYWFKLIDLDDNGLITGYEMEFFFEEQAQRLDYLQQEPVFYPDFLCQMIDMFKIKETIFTMQVFKECPKHASVFFDILTNLNKFVEYEQRDAFRIRQDILDFPGFSDWDLYAANEYARMSREEANEEYNDILEDGEFDYENELSFEEKK